MGDFAMRIPTALPSEFCALGHHADPSLFSADGTATSQAAQVQKDRQNRIVVFAGPNSGTRDGCGRPATPPHEGDESSKELWFRGWS